MVNETLHRFFIEGGQVTYSAKNPGEVTVPDYWLDVLTDEQHANIKTKILKWTVAYENFPSLSVAATAEILRMPYRHVLELIRLQHLGTIKKGGILSIYEPCIDVYLEKKARAPSWSKVWRH